MIIFTFLSGIHVFSQVPSETLSERMKISYGINEGATLEELFVTAENGARLYVQIHRPPGFSKNKKYPILVYSAPRSGTGGTMKAGCIKDVKDILRENIIFCTFDYEGAGKSENSNPNNTGLGPRLFKDLHAVLKYVYSLPEVEKDNIGIISFSGGCIAASWVLAHHPDDPPVKYWVDVEGPSDRYVITGAVAGTEIPSIGGSRKTGRERAVDMYGGFDNDEIWKPLEACRYVKDIHCRFLVVQAEVDHVQNWFFGHAIQMLNAALRGGNCPWTRCNSGPVNAVHRNQRTLDLLPGLVQYNSEKVIGYIKEMVEMPPLTPGLERKSVNEGPNHFSVFHSLQRLENGNTLIALIRLRPQTSPAAKNLRQSQRGEQRRLLPVGKIQREINSEIIEVNRGGKVIWSYSGDMKWLHTAERLPNGNTLIADTNNDRVFEIDRVGNVVWTYDTNMDYPNDSERLPNGNTLISVRDMDKVIEVTPEGRIVWEYTSAEGVHNPDRLPNGNTIIADSKGNRIIEVNWEGEIVWKYEGGLAWPRDADRLSNGNTLICDSNNHRVIEVTPEGNIVWEFKVSLPYDADRLPNGNTLITDDKVNSGTSRVIEVNRVGEVVWEFIDRM